eukprot:GHVS01029128.1.p1 GENE.GHVS01029128.1~~GHVS01029128.1.p1  ORF type:complete len:173 (-),score=20.71 GHVS01029128.1:317-835(-)
MRSLPLLFTSLLTPRFPLSRSFTPKGCLFLSTGSPGQGLCFSRCASSTAASSTASPPKQEVMQFSDYVPKYATRYVPYSGRLEGGAKWPYKMTWPGGYRGNHNFYGVIGFFQATLNNKADWGGKYYYLDKGFRVFMKIFVSGVLWFYVIDPYGIKKLKAKVRAKQEREAAAA